MSEQEIKGDCIFISGAIFLSCTYTQTFSISKSVLLRNRIIETPLNHLLFTMLSNMTRDSSRRLVRLLGNRTISLSQSNIYITKLQCITDTNWRSDSDLSSTKTWSNSELETRKRIDVTESKHWNHFCLWDRCPPTSTNRKGILLILITNSEIPLVAFRACRISWFEGLKS